MIITFRQGIVQQASSGGSPTFLSLVGTSVNLIASSANPTIIDFSQGQSDYLFQETADITSAWAGPFTSSANAWLYWDINMLSGVRTFGSTLYLPIVGSTPPSQSTTNGTTFTTLQIDQHWFDAANALMKVWNGSSWTVVVRCFAGSIIAGALVQNGVGSQVGISAVQVNAGYLLYDEDNNPIKKYQPSNLGEFITTASPLASQFSKNQNYRLETTIQTAAAQSTIPQWTAICYTGPAQIGAASCNNVAQSAIGIVTQPAFSNQFVDFVVSGYIYDPLGAFNTTQTFVEGQLVFVDPSGKLTTTPPVSGSIQRIGSVIDPQTICVDVQPQIILGI